MSAKNNLEHLTLYEFTSCPFCARVRQYLQQAQLEIARKDILQDQQAYRELLMGGGSQQVPCLRIGDGESAQWLYESADIIGYLQQETAAGS